MNYLITCLLLLLNIGCISDNHKTEATAALAMNERTERMEESTTSSQIEFYQLEFAVEKDKENNYILTVTLDLDEEVCFYSSIHPQDQFLGRFDISFEDKNNFIDAPGIKETQLMADASEPAPFIIGDANIFREDTNFTYQLSLNTQKDFSVMGTISIIIDPYKVYRKTPFTVSYRDGKLVVKEGGC
ncbi:MAG: hypothetical protein AAFP76_10685 [Bacteroidota bacterium]